MNCCFLFCTLDDKLTNHIIRCIQRINVNQCAISYYLTLFALLLSQCLWNRELCRVSLLQLHNIIPAFYCANTVSPHQTIFEVNAVTFQSYDPCYSYQLIFSFLRDEEISILYCRICGSYTHTYHEKNVDDV